MAKERIVVEYDKNSVFARALQAVQEQLGHREDPMQAMIDATVLYAIQKALIPAAK